MNYDVALTHGAHSLARQHLLQHFNVGHLQEDLCFALWRPSTAANRLTALIDEVLIPQEEDRLLHGNTSFTPDYMARAITSARRMNTGLAFMHSHPGTGWQDMSPTDVVAERDVLAYPAAATEQPLLGLTIGSDGYWSARLWIHNGQAFERYWCDKVRVIGPKTFEVQFGRYAASPDSRRNVLRRTFDTWGLHGQQTLSRLHIGIVGLGSVGSSVAESIARLGVERVTIVDPDQVEEHNLDRLLNATIDDIGKRKVDVAAKAMRQHSTAAHPQVLTYATSVHKADAYRAILECDVIFSCVDRPIARDVLNYVAIAHLVPVIDGGIAVQLDALQDGIFSAHWRTQLVTPYHRCMRCSEQYSTGMVMTELDGSLDDPSYLNTLPEDGASAGANVFPFSQSLASMEVNLMLRYLLAPSWWKGIHGQTHQLVTGETYIDAERCEPSCAFSNRVAKGDLEHPFYLTASVGTSDRRPARTRLSRLASFFERIFGRT
ncbi:MAG: ThiF family adenylyltransferase [Acidimicrobiaceae bacterium]|nr:ThiF family adenylyltransferase [Acidimicrobiaceae bacterium]MYL03285.1 ThiF family adenylyltransferase [Acidimicrobiaceae bacterium]